MSGAAAKVGMGTTSVYNLRSEPGAASFAEAWDRAQRTGFARLQDIAMDRAINGVSVPHYYKGELVGEGRWFDNRLLMFMMRQTMTRRYGPKASEFDIHETVIRHKSEKAKERAAFGEEMRALKADLESSVEFELQEKDANTDAMLDNLYKCQNLVSRALAQLESENDSED